MIYKDSSKTPLPPRGWKAQFDNHYSTWFFVDLKTKKSQWEAPEGTTVKSESPPSYSPPRDAPPASNHEYYSNSGASSGSIPHRAPYPNYGPTPQAPQGYGAAPAPQMYPQQPMYPQQSMQPMYAQQQMYPSQGSSSRFRPGLGTGLAGGALGGFLLGDMFGHSGNDYGAYQAGEMNGYQDGFDDGNYGDFGGGDMGDMGDGGF